MCWAIRTERLVLSITLMVLNRYNGAPSGSRTATVYSTSPADILSVMSRKSCFPMEWSIWTGTLTEAISKLLDRQDKPDNLDILGCRRYWLCCFE